jgi:hypothetical protein
MSISTYSFSQLYGTFMCLSPFGPSIKTVSGNEDRSQTAGRYC